MRRETAQAALVASVLLAALAVGIPLASAQDGQQGDENATTVVGQVDENVRVLGYSYDGDRQVMSVELENIGERRSVEVTLTEKPSESSSGSSEFGIQRQRVRPGETVTVEVDASRDEGGEAGVMITTAASIGQGSGVYVADVKDSGPDLSLFGGAATWGDVRSAGLFGMLATAVGLLVGSWDYVARKEQDAIEVDLDV